MMINASCGNALCAISHRVEVSGKHVHVSRCACGWSLWVAPSLRAYDVEPWAAMDPVVEAATATPKPAKTTVSKAAQRAAALDRKYALLTEAMKREVADA